MEPRELYEQMKADGLYTKSYEDFKAKYGTLEGQQKLHRSMQLDGLYTKDFGSFQSKYFAAPVEVKKKPSQVAGGVSSQPATTSSSTQQPVSIAENPYDAGGLIPRQQPITPVGVLAPKDPTPRSPMDSLRQSMQEFEKYQEKSSIYDSNEAKNTLAPLERNPDATYKQKDYSAAEIVVDGFLNSAAKGVVGDLAGGTLAGAGQLITMGHNKLFDDNATVKDSWLWQAGKAMQGSFEEGGVFATKESIELQESSLAQMNSAVFQGLGMIFSGGAPAAEGVAGKMLLQKAASQVFSRQAAMGAMMMVDEAATKISQQKEVADKYENLDDYIEATNQQGSDKNVVEAKWRKLREASTDSMVADMLPMIAVAGATEAIPVFGWFGRAGKATNGAITKIFLEKAKDVTVGTIEGASQEAVQEWMMNVSAKSVYDFTLNTTEGLEQAATVGGGSQFVLELLGAALGAKRSRMKADGASETELAELDKAEGVLAQKEETLARNLENQFAAEVPIAEVKLKMDEMVADGTATQEQADEAISRLESKKEAMSATPEALRSNPDIVEKVAEKKAIDIAIERLNSELEAMDASFSGQIDEELDSMELERAEIGLQIAEMAGLPPSPKDQKKIDQAIILNPKLAEKYAKQKAEAEGTQESVSSGEAAKEGEVLAAEPAIETTTYEPIEKLEVGKTYFDPENNRSYIYQGENEAGMLLFDKLPRNPKEVLFNTRIDAGKESNFTKALREPRTSQPVVQESSPEPQVAEPTAEQPIEPLVSQEQPMEQEATVLNTSVPPINNEPPSQETPQPIGGTGEMKRSRFESSEGSMAKAEASGQKSADFRQLADQNPQMYEVINLQGTGEDAKRYVGEKGAEQAAVELIESAKKVEENLNVGDQSKRMATVVALQAQWAQEVANGDPNASNTRSLMAQVQSDISRLGTKFGQENAQLLMWQASPEGIVAQAMEKVDKINQKSRKALGESGKTVEAEIAEFVEEVKTRLSPDEISAVVNRALGRVDGVKSARAKIAEGKKELGSAISRLAKATAGKLSSGVGLSKEQAAAVRDIFRAVAKITKGSIDSVRARFKKEVSPYMDADAAWSHIESNHLDELNKEKAARLTAKKVLKDIDPAELEAALSGTLSIDGLGSSLEARLRDELGLSDAEAKQVSDSLKSELEKEIAVKRQKEISAIVKKRMPKATPAARKTAEEKIIRAMALGGLDSEPLSRQIAEFYGIREFSPEELKMFGSIIEGAKTLPGQRLAQEKQQEILDYIQTEVIGDTLVNQLGALWFAGALSGPGTHWRNLLGNTSMLAEARATRAMADLILHAVNLVRPGTTEAGGTKMAWKNSQREFWSIMLDVGRIMSTGRGSRDFAKFTTSPTLERMAKEGMSATGRGLMSGAAKVFKWSPRLLQVSDAIFYGMSNAYVRGQQAYRQAVQEGYTGRDADKRAMEILGGGKEQLFAKAKAELEATGQPFTDRDVRIRAQEIMQVESGLDMERQDEAVKVAEFDTLINQPYGISGSIVSAITHGVNTFAPAGNRASSGFSNTVHAYIQKLFPFMRTASNLFNRGFDYVPVGGALLRGFEYKHYKDGKFEIPQFRNDNEVAVFLSRQIIGLSTLMLLKNLFDNDEEDGWHITANLSPDFNKQAQIKATGEEPWSIVWKDGKTTKSFSYKDTPIAPIFAIVAADSDARRWGDPTKTAEENASASESSAMLAYFADQAMLGTLNDATSFVKDDDSNKLMKLLVRPISGILKPGIIRHIENLIDPRARETRMGDEWYEKFGYAVAANTMIADKALFPEKLNPLGDVVQPDMSLLFRATGLDAVAKSKSDVDPVIKALVDKSAFFPKVMKRDLPTGEMDDETFYKFALAVGRYRKKYLTENLDKIKKESYEETKDRLRELSGDANKFGKGLVMGEDLKSLTRESIDKMLEADNGKGAMRDYDKVKKKSEKK
jgi:hypothetical protein